MRKKLTYLAFFRQAITSDGSSLEVELVDICGDLEMKEKRGKRKKIGVDEEYWSREWWRMTIKPEDRKTPLTNRWLGLAFTTTSTLHPHSLVFRTQVYKVSHYTIQFHCQISVSLSRQCLFFRKQIALPWDVFLPQISCWFGFSLAYGTLPRRGFAEQINEETTSQSARVPINPRPASAGLDFVSETEA